MRWTTENRGSLPDNSEILFPSPKRQDKLPSLLHHEAPSGGGKGSDNLQNDEGEDEDETGKENKAIKKLRAI